ncbi:hypothetical protein ACOMHN_051680 [Nucella lapillus]
MFCGSFPVLDANTILEDLERKVRSYDEEIEEGRPVSLDVKMRVELMEEGGGDAKSCWIHAPLTNGESGRLKLEKQGSLLSGDRPDSLSVPLSITSLSSLRIAAMSEAELRAVLPELVATLQQGETSRKPDWWPHSTIPWTPHCLSTAVKSANPACLRGLVSQCYSYLTQHSGPLNPTQPRIPPQPRVLDWLNSHPPSRSCAQPVKNCGISSAKRKLKDGVPYLDIHLCNQCNEEFSAQDTLQKHQVQCSGGSLALSVPSTPPASDAPSPTPTPTIASDDTSVSGATVTRPQSASKYALPPFGKFVAALDLVPVHRARKILQSRRRNTECETIDLEEPKTPISPPTPRTPKLLISLLSREGGPSSSSGGSGSQGASSRRRLSYLHHSVDRQDDRSKEADTGTDEESSDSGTDDADEPKLHKKSLFSIDVTSGLGQRVLRHMTVEGHMPLVLDSEQFCHTPIKDKYQDRLRTRQLSYPVTWKCTGKRQRQQSNYHLYNFTRAQKFEFMEKMRTGLNWRCRKLLHCLKKCSVLVRRLSAKTLRKWKPSLNKVSVPLTRLTEKEILFWMQPKATGNYPGLSQYLTVQAVRVDQAHRLKHKDHSSSCSVPHCQEMTCNHVAFSGLPKSSRANTVQFPDKVCSDGGKLQDGLPLGNALSSDPASPGFKSPCGERESWIGTEVKTLLKIEIPSLSGLVASARSSKNSHLDDSFSVMTVSSSDEESTRNGACCVLCRERSGSLTSSQRLPFTAATRRCAHSPASTSSMGSSVPREMSSPGTQSASSHSSPPASSPSCPSSLSLSASCSSQSSASTVKSGWGRPHKEPPLCRLRSAGTFLAQHECCKGSRTDRVQTGSGHATKDRTGLTQNGVVLKVSEDPHNARIDAQSSKNMKESRKWDMAASFVNKSVNGSGSRGRREATPEPTWNPPYRRTARTHSVGSTVQHTGGSSDVQCRQQKRMQDRREHPCSSERIKKEQEMDARSGSGNSVISSDNGQKGMLKTWHSTDNSDWVLRNGSDVHKVCSQVVNMSAPKKRTLNGSVDGILDCAQKEVDVHRQRNIEGMGVENGTDLEHCRGGKLEVTQVHKNSHDSNSSCPSSLTDSNPFLLSQAESPLFSCLLQQACGHWTSPQKLSPDENDAGSTFQLGNGNLNSPLDRSAPVTGDSSVSIGPSPSSISHHCSNSPQKLDSSQCFLAKTDSPLQTPPARKLLSALQMLSVLESARSRTSPGKSRGSRDSTGKRRKSRNSNSVVMVSPSAQASYHQTRSQESLFSALPRKRVRLADRLHGMDFKRRSKQMLPTIEF